MGQLVGAAVQLATGKRGLAEAHGDGVWRGGGLGLDQMLDARRVRIVVGRGAGIQQRAQFAGRDIGDAAHRPRDVRHDGFEQGAIAGQPAIDGGGVEQIGAVIAIEPQPFVRIRLR